MDKKNQQSKAQFGTMTAKQDANQDYTSSASSYQSGTSSSMGGASGTLTAKYDANNDYGGKGSSQSGQTGQQKVKTSDKNINK